ENGYELCEVERNLLMIQAMNLVKGCTTGPTPESVDRFVTPVSVAFDCGRGMWRRVEEEMADNGWVLHMK
ncbi:unnamed protein product, partial [Effrenium voratum]